MITARLAMVTIDCADPGPVAAFWATLLGMDVVHSDDDYAMVAGGSGAALGFGRVEGFRPPEWPNPAGTKQFHLDLAVDDIAVAADRALELGATLADPQPGDTWRVLLDPAGHPFCLTAAANWG